MIRPAASWIWVTLLSPSANSSHRSVTPRIAGPRSGTTTREVVVGVGIGLTCGGADRRRHRAALDQRRDDDERGDDRTQRQPAAPGTSAGRGEGLGLLVVPVELDRRPVWSLVLVAHPSILAAGSPVVQDEPVHHRQAARTQAAPLSRPGSSVPVCVGSLLGGVAYGRPPYGRRSLIE